MKDEKRTEDLLILCLQRKRLVILGQISHLIEVLRNKLERQKELGIVRRKLMSKLEALDRRALDTISLIVLCCDFSKYAIKQNDRVAQLLHQSWNETTTVNLDLCRLRRITTSIERQISQIEIRQSRRKSLQASKIDSWDLEDLVEFSNV